MGNQYSNDGWLQGRESAAAIESYTLMKLAANNTVVVATAGDDEQVIGSCPNAITAAAKPVSVRLMNTSGTHILRASAAISVNDPIKCAAGGKIATAATGNPAIGYALEAAGADDDLIECVLTGHFAVD